MAPLDFGYADTDTNLRVSRPRCEWVSENVHAAVPTRARHVPLTLVLYSLLRPVARIALRWYYRSVEVVGLERIPHDGPVLLAGNHPNALMDALVIGVLVPRPVRLLAKSTLFRNPLVGAILRGAGVIPLYRARDAASAEGAALDPSRNASSFRAVAEALADGGAVVIFPEGTSHDEPQLVPLRTGLARMALEARDEHDVGGVTIVPLGLVFEHKEVPRTRVLLQVAAPIALDTLGEHERTVQALTEEIDKRLRSVTLNFATTEESERVLALAHALAVLLAPVRAIGSEQHHLVDVVRLVRRIERASGVSRVQAERVRAFESRFAAFRNRLRSEGLKMEDVAIELDTGAAATFALREGGLALLRGPIGMWGRINHWLPITITRTLALRGVSARDQPAMRSVVMGLALVLAFYALQTALVARLGGPWWAMAYALTLVPSAHHDLRYGDRTSRGRARMRAYFRFRGDPALQQELLREAQWLRQEAGALEQSASS